jgi:hypothetical protein
MASVRRLAVLFTLIAASACWAQGTYHRFYQGHLVAGLTAEKFEQVANQEFLPLFPQAHPQGLVAYRPALIKSEGTCKLPAWIALLTFRSEPVYTAYTQSEIGKKIRAAHAPVFDGQTSKSAVPAAFAGTVQYGQAYALKAEFDDYPGAESVLVVHCDVQVGLEQLPERIAKAYAAGSAAANIVFSVSPGHLAEYVFARTPSELEKLVEERKNRFQGTFAQHLTVPLPKRKIGAESLTPGNGLDARF